MTGMETPTQEQLISSADFELQAFPLPLPPVDKDDKKQHLTSWPVLYVLTNKRSKTVYIGETTNYRRRMDEHVHNARKDFDQSLLIDSPTFNQSSTFDFESRLIDLFLADEKYHVTNLNNGYTAFDYYQRDLYRQKFRKLWKRLQEEGYATRPLEELENTDLFKYSPYKSLTPDQYETVESIIKSVKGHESDRVCTVVNGAPGTGKTILAMSLLLKLKTLPETKHLKVGFVCPMQSLRKTLKALTHSLEGIGPRDILGPSEASRGDYDILLVDEAHRLHGAEGAISVANYRKTCDSLGLSHEADQLDWLLTVSKKVFLFFDEKQLVKATGLNGAKLDKKLGIIEEGGGIVDHFHLSTQMRVRGGDEYLDYVYDLLNGTPKTDGSDLWGRLFTATPVHASGMDKPLYQFALVESFEDFCDLQRQKEHEAGLSRFMAGYAWDWSSKKDKSKADITLEGIGLQWNSQTNDWVNSPNAPHEVGCVHTVQGYDLNYGFVIVGDDLAFSESGTPIVERKNFKDAGAKKLSTDESVVSIVTNAYYVLLTRGTLGTFVYAAEPETKRYLSKFIPVIRRDAAGKFVNVGFGA